VTHSYDIIHITMDLSNYKNCKPCALSYSAGFIAFPVYFIEKYRFWLYEVF